METLDAAARAAGGSSDEDASRAHRARNAHWAPQLRSQFSAKDEERDRAGEYRLAPIRDHSVGTGQNWSVTITWDLSQIVYAREESQLALAAANLAKLRRDAQQRAAGLWVERLKARARISSARTREACLELLQLTAELDALTAGLFREALSREQVACNPEEPK